MYFVTVAEERHFGRAATRLHIGQPAVSQQVRRLERELGVELLDRTPRYVRLTAAGEEFLPAARAVLDSAERAAAVAARLAGGWTGTLRLGTSTGLGARLDAVLDGLALRAPHLGVELTSAPTAERLDRVAAGTLDAAFVRGGHDAPALRLHPVWQDPLLVVLPTGHELAAAEDVPLSALAALPLRLVPRRRNPPLVDLVVRACHDAGFEPRPGPPSTSLENTLAEIGAGAPTWTVVYAAHARQLRGGRVAFLRPRDGLSLVTSVAVRAVEPSAYTRLVLEVCAGQGNDHDS